VRQIEASGFDSQCVVMLGKHICEAIEEDATEWPADLIVIDAELGCRSTGSSNAMR
jgi:hypothetical protein